MANLIVILGDQLSKENPVLKQAVKSKDTILMVEVMEEASYVEHHPKKIALIFSAMRHFAKDLKDDCYNVRYVQLKDKDNTGSFTREVKRACDDLDIDEIKVLYPGEYRVLKAIEQWEHQTGKPTTILDDDRFFCTIDDFRKWAEDRKTLRMEYFYREMRKAHNILMDGDKPKGGEWNYDDQNRKSIPDNLSIPKRLTFEPDEITGEVLDLVEKEFGDNFGDLKPFWFAVTREDALKALDHFLDDCLDKFGDYQDAMVHNEHLLFHSLLSMYINIGLLEAKEVVEKAENRYTYGNAPLNAVEGFIRQIIGWREFIRGIYWMHMPDYANENFLSAKRSLPDFYWSGKTDMNCMAQAIGATKENAYAHHIQRLMIAGNFALLAGIKPDEVQEWYLAVYADAFEWVEMPNVVGMALFADGGVFASKPYAGGGSYINKMSDYCKNCYYAVSKKNGERACPFNYLYWNFLIENEDRLKNNPRVGMMYSTLGRMSDKKVEAIKADSERFLSKLKPYKKG
ncbi:MAG: cryptochrome/photolyase family protein [Rickettsiales bacterium]|nr:cryptochrome/photolyase family protein [Rickettsiales bacterium]|tara:strand:+ start:460 stop:1998 length:1539 start_codon:yes stop_codon:yes gene_type:complete